ncbi:transposase (plasmid) [Legionella pneumophila]
MSREVRNYDKEFKLNAVKLCLESGKGIKAISTDLGIPSSTLRTWTSSFKQDGIEAFPGKGKLAVSDAELAALHRELAIVKEERDILKKALGIFSAPKK